YIEDAGLQFYLNWNLQVALSKRAAVPSEAPKPERPAMVADMVATTLLRLKRQSYEVRRFGIYPWTHLGSQIAVRGQEAWIADRLGNFFEVRFDGEARFRQLPLKLETNFRT